MPKVPPKRVDIEKLRAIMGDAEVDRILTALLRQQVEQIICVTQSDVRGAKAFLEEKKKTLAHRFAFARVCHKWLTESTRSKGKFTDFCNRLLKAAVDIEN